VLHQVPPQVLLLVLGQQLRVVLVRVLPQVQEQGL
jgi:hypothetical protein